MIAWIIKRRVRWVLSGIIASTCLCLGADRTLAQVSATPEVAELGYATLQGEDAAETFQRLNESEFWSIPRFAPSGYYGEVPLDSAAELRAFLHELLAHHTVFPYTTSTIPGDEGHRVDVWDIVAIADAHPERRDRVLDIYLNGTFDRQTRGVTWNPRYDREHSWPKSLGFEKLSVRNIAYTDCHHLFAAYSSYNSSRSNKPYDEITEAGRDKPTLENVGRGGGLSEGDSSNLSGPNGFEVWHGRRGDVARAMFYMALRYDGGRPGEPDLRLTDDLTEVTVRKRAWESGDEAFMGALSTLLDWHAEDPVDDLERRRNSVVYFFQGNRNPFVDHPEWVGVVYGDEAPGNPNGMAVMPWINEFHYDNDGPDKGEFVEVAGPAGTDLRGWRLVGYNGRGGRAYRTVELSGLIPDESHGYGALSFDFSGLQNGGPEGDGIALIDGQSRVVEFLSYEGSFSASDGPAKDTPSINIGVAQLPTTPAGTSIELRGRGRSQGDFTWSAANVSTPGSLNPFQDIEP